LNIPQYREHANAYGSGVGVSRRSGPGLFGMMSWYQPIWSTTWPSEHADGHSGGGLIPVGGRTMRERLHFSNALFRLGVSREVARFAHKDRHAAARLLGAFLHYNLAQRDFVEAATHQLNNRGRNGRRPGA